MSDTLAFSPKAIRDLLLAQAVAPRVIEMSQQLGFNYPLFLLDEITRRFAVSPDFNDPAIDLLLSRRTELGFIFDDGWIKQAVQFSPWASLDQAKKLVAPCIERGPVLATIRLLERTEAPVDKEDMFRLASRVQTDEEKDELCAFVQAKRPDLLMEVALKCEASLLDDIPF